MENQEQIQPSAHVPARNGLRALLVITVLIALVFVTLTAYFWVRSSALDRRVSELDNAIVLYETELTAVGEERGREERNPSETTYLAAQTQDRWDGGLCTFVYEQLKDADLPDETLNGAGLSLGGVLDPMIQQAIVSEIVVGAGWTGEYFARIASHLQRSEERLLAQCNFNNRLFVAAANEDGLFRLLEWVPDELITRSRFDAYQPIDGMMDMVFSLFDYEDFDDPVIATGYGDAGHLWWELHLLDAKTFTSDLIESCSDIPVFDDEGNWTDDRVITCEREYVPQTE